MEWLVFYGKSECTCPDVYEFRALILQPLPGKLSLKDKCIPQGTVVCILGEDGLRFGLNGPNCFVRSLFSCGLAWGLYHAQQQQ